MNKLFKKGKTITVILLVVCIILSTISIPVFAATDGDSASLDGLVTKNGTNAKYFLLDRNGTATDVNVPYGYRFSAVDPDGNFWGTAVDVYYKATYQEDYYCVSNRWGKKKWKEMYESNGKKINTDWLKTSKLKDADKKKVFVGGNTDVGNTSAIGFSLPQCIDRNVKINEYDKSGQIDLLHNFSVDGDKLTEVTKRINAVADKNWANFSKDYILIAEPIYFTKLTLTKGKTTKTIVVATTPTELVAFGQQIKGKDLITSSGNQSDFSWIANYSNKYYPSILHEDEDHPRSNYNHIIPYVNSAKIRKMQNSTIKTDDGYEKCSNIITYAYGMIYIFNNVNPPVYLKIRYQTNPTPNANIGNNTYKITAKKGALIRQKSNNAVYETKLSRSQTKTLFTHEKFGLTYEYYHDTNQWKSPKGNLLKDGASVTINSLGYGDIEQNTTITIVSVAEENKLIVQYKAAKKTNCDPYISGTTDYSLNKTSSSDNYRYIVDSKGNRVSQTFSHDATKDLYNASTFNLKRDNCKFENWQIGSKFLNQTSQYSANYIGQCAGKGADALRYSNADIYVTANAVWKEFSYVTYNSNNKLNKEKTESALVGTNKILADINALNFKENQQTQFLGWGTKSTFKHFYV